MRKMAVIICGCLIVLIGATAFFAPTILSTRWGNQRLVTTLNHRIPGKVQIERFAISWFGVQKVEGLVLLDPQGETVLSLQSFETDTPLFTLLKEGPVGGQTRLDAFSATIKKGASGRTNIQESLGSMAPLDFPVDEAFSITDAQVEFSRPSRSRHEMLVKGFGKTELGGVSGQFNIDFQWGGNEEKWQADIQNFPVGILDGLMAAQHSALTGQFRALLGDSMDIKVKEGTEKGKTWWNLSAKSKNLRLSCSGDVENGVVLLTSPAEANLKVSSNTFNRYADMYEDLAQWRLSSPAEISILVNELRVPLNFLYSTSPREQIALQATASLPHGEWMDQSGGSSAKVKNLTVTIDSPIRSKQMHVRSRGEYFVDQTPVKFAFEAVYLKPDSVDAIARLLPQPSEVQFSLDSVPTRMVDRVLGTDDAILNALGSQISLRVQSVPGDPKSVRMSLNSEKTDIPSILFTLNQGVPGIAAIGQRDLNGMLTIEKIVFKKSKGSPIVHTVKAPWKIGKGFRNASINFSAISAISGEGEGALSGDVFIESLLDPASSRLTLDVNGHNIPASFLTLVSGRNEVDAVLGSSVKMDVSAHLKNLNGSIKAEMSGTNGHISLDGYLVNGNLQLNRPFYAETKGTQELGKKVLGQFAPVFKEMVSSDGKLKLTVSPKGFFLPVRPVDFTAMQMDSAELEMGRLVFKNAGDVKDLLSVLRTARSKEISVWTTPLYLSFQNGKMTVYRMDMLIMDRYPIATWGTIDFAKDRVNMIVGITGAALSQALEVDGIPQDTVVQVPVKGTIDNARIDSSKVTTKIGSLIAQRSGGPEGLVIGTILELANGREAKVPKPTTSPLPWAGRDFSGRNGHTTERELSGEKTDPIREIQKEASKLLKGIFR